MENKKKALIIGITGQDGSYLAEFLLEKGYEVHGMIRRSSSFNTDRLEKIYEDPHIDNRHLILHYGDLSDSNSINSIINKSKPDEIYNLGAQSHVKVSFDMPEHTGDVTGLGTTRILEAVKRSGVQCRFYQASSSEMFGASPPPQNEKTPFYPRSPYAAAKVYSYWMTVNYREAYNIYAINGILFNHESPRRGETFLTRKVTRGVANILAGTQDYVYLGNLDAKRDWGYAPEFVECMWLMLQNDKPEDFVIGTGETHTVRECVEAAFRYAGLDWEKHVRIDEKYLRPTEVEALKADSGKAHKVLGWKPRIEFADLIKIMIDADVRSTGSSPIGEGDKILKERFPRRYWSRD